MRHEPGHATNSDPAGSGEQIVGLTLDEAVAVVAASDRDDACEAQTTRAVLEPVCQDGVVRREGLRDAVAHASKVVATPETRLELATAAVSDARATAADLADIDTVRSRLDAFDARLDALAGRTERLADDLGDVVARLDDPHGVFAVARDVRQLETVANRTQQAIDELIVDAESFERWLDSPAVRYRELDGDADVLETGLVDLDRTADELTGNDPIRAFETAGRNWYDGVLRHRVLGLFFSDLRSELADCRQIDDRQNADAGDRSSTLGRRLDRLASRRDTTGERFADAARPDWWSEFGGRVHAFEAAIDEHEPPVDWGTVQEVVYEHRDDD